MDLESLVTDNLASDFDDTPPKFQASAPLQILEKKERASKEEIRRLLRKLPGKVEKNPQIAPYGVAQIIAYLSETGASYRFPRNTLWITCVAATHSQTPRKKHLREIKKWAEELEEAYEREEELRLEKLAIGNIENQIDLLREVFEDDLAKELVQLSGVTLPTAKRWIGGGRMAWRHSQRISKLARLFYRLERQAGISGKDARSWYEDNSVRDSFSGRHAYIMGDLSHLLQKMGISL